MKRIILCFDGTWNTPADDGIPPDQQVETNVSRFYKSVTTSSEDGTPQTKWYCLGVGTQWYDKITGGVFGAGLDRHIVEGYNQLVHTYEAGDEVYILGFSRGAYTARSLVGMIRNSGLVKPSFADWRVGAAFGIYRTRDDGPDSIVAKAFRAAFAQEITIKFLGVWDTVGELGIPLTFANQLNKDYFQFHDTTLSSIVENAYHALAIDEHRKDYNATLWDPPADPAGQNFEQRWFCGAHCDVGGGYSDRRLSDMTLRWMQDRAGDAGLTTSKVSPDTDNYKGLITDSYAKFLNGDYKRLYPPLLRPVLATKFGHEVLDPSYAQRRDDPDMNYAPTNPGLPQNVPDESSR